VANPSNPYYNSPRYGARYHSFSNFLFWSWAFHAIGDDELYDEEYIEPNYDFGGWALSGSVWSVSFYSFEHSVSALKDIQHTPRRHRPRARLRRRNLPGSSTPVRTDDESW